MADILINVDTLLAVYRYDNEEPLVGHFSKYRDIPHFGTNKPISGWRWDERSWPGTDSTYSSVVPLLNNADLSSVPLADFQSGIGSGKDLEIDKVIPTYSTQSISHWSPIINHGYYYDFNEERYLFSDTVRTQYHLDDMTDSDSVTPPIPLDEFTKATIPIKVRTYKWDSVKEKYAIDLDLAQKVYFSGIVDGMDILPTYDSDRQIILTDNIDTAKPEFITEVDDNTLVVRLNKRYITQRGSTDFGLPDDIILDEILGVSTGIDNAQYHTKYSPIDNTLGIALYTFIDVNISYQTWTLVDDFSHDNTSYEFKLDPHLGIITFGSVADNDLVPTNGDTISIMYWSTLEIQYEPESTPNIYTAIESTADINPIRHTSNKGFIFLRTFEQQPTSIILTSSLPEISLYNYGPLYIGNIYTNVYALVLDQFGDPIPDYDVTFTLNDTPNIGLFSNGYTSVTTTTNDEGIATAFYIPPLSIDEIGEFIGASGYSTIFSDTLLNTSSIKISNILRNIYLYKVWTDDPVMGIPLGDQATLDAGGVTTELQDFYEEFFIEEYINGPTGLPAVDGAPWENTHRLIRNLLRPAPFNRSFRNGRKQIVATYDTTAINPHSDTTGAFVPLQPDIVTLNIGGDSTNNILRFTNLILDPPEVGDLDSYLVISPTNIVLQASAINLDGNTIESNEVEIQLDIAPSQNGTIYIDSFNDLPTDLLSYPLDGDDDGMTLPVGFRIKSTNITLASALNGVTYLDINKLAYMGHAFNIR